MSSEAVMQAFSFSEEDLSANSSGYLTEAQKEMLREQRRSRTHTRRFAGLSIGFAIAILSGVFLCTSDHESAAYQQALPYYTVTYAVFALLFGFFAVLGWHRSRDMRSGTISTTEGEVRTWITKYKHGTGFFAEVGGVRFRLHSKEQMDALNSSSFWRIRFVRNPPVHVIMSVEETG